MKIDIATPMYGGQCFGEYHEAVMNFYFAAASRGHLVRSRFTFNESLIQRARNVLASEFLMDNQGSDYLLFIDSDIDFDADKMLDMIEEEKDIIGAITPIKHIDFVKMHQLSTLNKSYDNIELLGSLYNINVKDQDAVSDNLINNVSFEVDRIGTGVMAIKRSVLEQMSKKVEEYIDDNNHTFRVKRWNFFPVTIEYDERWGGNRMMSEDYNFCNIWRSMGGKVYAKNGIVRGHNGYYKYKGDLGLQMKIINSIK